MTDIHQWRRMIQPARVRTPAIEPDEGSLLSPTTPRKGLKPKLSSYFTQNAAIHGPSKTDVISEEDIFSQTSWYPLWSDDGLSRSLDIERLMESVMCKLLAEPYRPLDSRFNTMLMQIFEGYRHLKDERDRLQLQHLRDTERRDTLEQALHHASEQWEVQRQDFKAEVKRLELILAQGKRGLAEVTLDRQNSVLRHGKQYSVGNDDSLETIFEFLEKTKRYEDRAWSSQRATMRRRSPSTQMRRLSRTLVQNDATTTATVDPPYGRPPLSDFSFLAEEGIDHQVEGTPRPNSQAKTYVSDDTLSTFSCAGDFLPDETAEANLIHNSDTDSDLAAMKRIAHVLARRRNVNLDTVMPKMVSSLEASAAENGSSSLPTGLGIQLPSLTSTRLERAQMAGNLQKNPPLKVKAAGLLSKLKPQLNIDTATETGRRFSFEAGDDTMASLSAPPLDTLPPTVRDRLIRKSASMSSLEVGRMPTQEPLLSPVAQSPTTLATPQEFARTPPDQEEAKKYAPTRIPTPNHTSSLARPRREREDSASSLLTAIKVSRPVSRRSGSSSSYSSPSASRTDLTQGVHAAETGPGSRQKRNSLLHHTTSLRGGLAAIAAQKAANINLNDSDQQPAATHGQRRENHSNNNRSSTLSYTDLDSRECRKENFGPINGSTGSSRQGNATR